MRTNNVNIKNIIKIINRIYSEFFWQVTYYRRRWWTSNSNCCSWGYSNISKVFETSSMNKTVYWSSKFSPLNWTLNCIWKILIVIIIRNYLIIKTQSANIVIPSNSFFIREVNFKSTFIFLDFAYCSNIRAWLSCKNITGN